jgi:hypothetical protein
MSHRSSLAVGLFVVAWPLAALAAPPAEKPRIEPVVGHVPAESAGFIVINNLDAAAGKVEKLLADLGLDDFLKMDPENPKKKAKLAEMLPQMAQLGEGFNSSGGMAAVLLDPKAYGVDVEAWMKKKMGPGAGAEEGAAGPNAQPKAQPKLPVLILMPGKGIEKMLAAYKPTQAGKYFTVTLPTGPMFAAQLGNYVALSPNEKALDAAMDPAVKSAAADLPPEQAKLLGDVEIALHLNMKVLSPIIDKAMAEAKKQMSNESEMPPQIAPLLKTYLAFIEKMTGQMTAVTVAARIGETGLVLDEMVSFKAGSVYAKSIASAQPMTGTGVEMLPDLKYVLAGGGTANVDAEGIKSAQDLVRDLLAGDLFKAVAPETKARAEKLAADMLGQITGVQFVGGGAPEGSGLFGVAYVLGVKDADAFKGLIALKVSLVETLVKQAAAGAGTPDANEVARLSIKYVKAVDTVAGTAVDAVIVDHPKMNEMKPEDRAEMKKVLGEDALRFRVAAVGKNTVVVTFGGGAAFMGETLKAAAGKGGIAAAAALGDALRYLPARKTGLVLFNAANLYDLIVAGMKKMDPEEKAPAAKITTTTPVFLASGTTGVSAHVVVFVPTKLIKEGIGLVKSLTHGAAGGATEAAPPAAGGAVVKPGDL